MIALQRLPQTLFSGGGGRGAVEPTLWFLLSALVYWLATHHLPIDQKHYVLMADAFLKGSLSVSNPPPDLIEAIHYNGGIYFGYGVMPAVVLMPFVAVWGRAFDPAIASILLGAGTVVITNRILPSLQISCATRTWLTALFAFGTVQFLASIWGTTWFLMQVVSIFFLSLSIYFVLVRRLVLLAGLCFGAAVLSRNAVLVALPFYLILIWHRDHRWKLIITFFAALAAIMVPNAAYNYLRFGSPFENGYAIAWNGPKGLFNLRYLPGNVYTYFLKPPEWLGAFPFLRPSLDGMSLFLTTPALLLLIPTLRQLGRDLLTLASWTAVAAVGGLYLCYFWPGFAQFGVRYTLDFTPFLMILIALACRDGLNKPGKALVILSIAVNLWGIAWWRYYYFATSPT